MQEGLDPTLGAVLPLVGVLLGALASGGANYLLKRRDEKRDSRAAVRLLDDELATYESRINLGVKVAGTWVVITNWTPGDAVWRGHQLLLGRHLSDDEWHELRATYGMVGLLPMMVSHTGKVTGWGEW